MIFFMPYSVQPAKHLRLAPGHKPDISYQPEKYRIKIVLIATTPLDE